MYKGKTVAVVVPAYNEEKQIGMVIESMPAFVDRIVIVNDCSTDETAEVVLSYIKRENGKFGRGGSFNRLEHKRDDQPDRATGYRKAEGASGVRGSHDPHPYAGR